MRFNELIAGVRSDVGIKLFGDDLETLCKKGEEIRRLLVRQGKIVEALGAAGRVSARF